MRRLGRERLHDAFFQGRFGSVSYITRSYSVRNHASSFFWKSENVARRYVGLGAVSPKNMAEIGKLSEEDYDWIDKFAAMGSCAEHALFPRTSSSSPG